MTRAELFKIFYSQDCSCRIGRSLVYRVNHDQMIVVDWDGNEHEVCGILTAFNMFCKMNGVLA